MPYGLGQALMPGGNGAGFGMVTYRAGSWRFERVPLCQTVEDCIFIQYNLLCIPKRLGGHEYLNREHPNIC